MTKKKSRILVTGAGGFIGRNIVSFLQKKDDFEIIPLTHSDGDIRNIDLQNYSPPDQVIHLANLNFIPDSWENPGDFFSVNIDGTRNVLEFCRKTKARIIFTSSYVYGKPEYLPVDEDHPIRAVNPYMQSKIMAEELIRFYAENFDVSALILRPFNIFGSGQRTSYLIPTIAKQLVKSNPGTVIVQNLKPKRDFLHLEDFNRALSVIVEQPELTGVFNIGCGKSYSVETIIQTFAEIIGKPIQYTEEGKKRDNEVMDVVAEIAKISSATGWTPQLSLKEGLRKVLKSTANEM